MIKAKKIVPCLDTRNGKVVKGVKFEGVRDIDNPVTLARYYNETGADELVLYDIAASVNNQVIFSDLIKSVMNEITIPLTIGGGIKTVADAERVLSLGSETQPLKLSINSGVISNPALVREITEKFGAVCVVSIDVKADQSGEYKVYKAGGMKATERNALEWAKKLEADGACEFVINAIDTDGVKGGFDLDMLKAFSAAVKTPIIASGGAGKPEHFLKLFHEIPEIAGALAASVFHFKEINIAELKSYLAQNGIETM